MRRSRSQLRPRDREDTVAGSIDPATGKTRVEPGKEGPQSETQGDQGMYTNARSAEGGADAAQPIINPDDPYNRGSGAGTGDKGTTIIGAGTTAEETTPAKAKKAVAHPPTDAFDEATASLHPAGDTKTTTADDLIDASDSVSAGVSQPIETSDFARLQEAHQRVAPRTLRQVRKDEGDGFGTEITGTPRIGETIVARITGVTIYDKVWLRVKGPDQDSRVRCAHEGETASQAVMITRPGKYVIGFEVNTKLVGETEFEVE